jgi:hypothetical protein
MLWHDLHGLLSVTSHDTDVAEEKCLVESGVARGGAVTIDLVT